MSMVIVSGDVATTTALALSAAWPAQNGPSPILVEADPGGGSLAAWLDTPAVPSLSTAVTATDPTVETVEGLLHQTPSGIRLLPAPVRTLEAARAVLEAEVRVLPLLASCECPIAIVDSGRARPGSETSIVWRSASAVVLVHRQASASARAGAVRVERFAEHVERVVAAGIDPWLVVVGRQPFDPEEIVAVASGGTEPPPARLLPDDPLAAAVLAGRTGVSARRFARLPLVRAARRLARELDEGLRATHPGADAHRPRDVPSTIVNGSTPGAPA